MEYRTWIDGNTRKSNWYEFCKDWNEFRLGYKSWRLALKRGHKIPLSYFFKDGKKIRLRISAARPKAYFYAKRQAQLARAMPKWVDIEQIAEFYEHRPSGYQVDHIVPINGKNISGLHVPWNLQYLPSKDNIKKSNS